jgi:hypothetical protein
MAGWLTAFKVIPWGEVIAAAPAIAKGARQLWSAVRKQDALPAGAAPGDRIHALESRVEELRRELAASAELTATLAEQNARLIEAVAILRLRTRVLLAVSGVTIVAVVGLAAALFSR